jgi:prefoldin subunit 5
MELLIMAEPDIQTARELATHAADIKHLQDDMDKLVSDMEEIKKSLATINSTLSEARGGWRMLLLIGGASGTAGAALAQFVHYLMGR